MIARILFVFLAAWTALPLEAQAEYRDSYATDMEAFVEEVERVYPFFDLKGIRKDWATTAKRIQKDAKKCKSDADFMGLVLEAIACLRDAHVSITECAVEIDHEPEFYPGVSFLPATDGRVVVMYPPEGQGAGSLPTGAVVLKINGKKARAFLDSRAEEVWEEGGHFSSPQRARLFEYRLPLRGERGEKHTLDVLIGKKKKKVKVSARQEISGWPRYVHLPKDLKKVGRSFYYQRHESGAGYMVLRRVDSSISQGIAEALEKVPDAQGWVIDLRGNSGGGYDQDLKARVDAIPGKVAVILDAGCISAGETLARDFVELCDARLFGSTTAGSSSVKTEFAFPSGIAKVRISTRTRRGINGKDIEFLGIEPHEPAEYVPEELQEGKDSLFLRALEWLSGA